MQEALAQLEATYLTLQQQINMLGVACQSQDQRDSLSTQYVQARQNYWACVNKAFHDDDPQVVNLTNALTAANQQLTRAAKEMGDIAAALNNITKVVTLGSQLAAKVIIA